MFHLIHAICCYKKFSMVYASLKLVIFLNLKPIQGCMYSIYVVCPFHITPNKYC